MARPRVLFLCTGNTARSQMAEGLLRTLAPDRFEAFSAGLDAQGVNPLAIAVMAERDIDISGQRSKTLAEYLGRLHFGYLITVCDRAERKCPTFPGMGTRLRWPIPDPALAEGGEEERLAVFRSVRDALEARIRLWLENDPDHKGAAGLAPTSASPEARQ